jgi:hypothetical protein
MGLLIHLVVVVVIAALLWWLLTFVPIPDPARRIVNVLFIVILVLILLFEFLLPLAHMSGGFSTYR